MEVTGAAYLYTIAVIGITFIGFSAIVMMLRQTSGQSLQRFDILIAHVYMEFGLIVSVGSLLPPLFSFWGLGSETVWRVSSVLVGASLLLFSLTYPPRRRKAIRESLPWYTKINIAVIILLGVVFVRNGKFWIGNSLSAALALATKLRRAGSWVSLSAFIMSTAGKELVRVTSYVAGVRITSRICP